MFHVKQLYYDIVVVGAGHAGVESATMCSRLGAKTALITFKESDIGTLSCNPAMGGLGKGHLIREIDAMGGLMAIATDCSGIQYRTLNTRKGDAVQALRVQCDRSLYSKAVQEILKKTDIEIINEEVVDFVLNDNVIKGVETNKTSYLAKKVILTTGTFLNGRMYTGNDIKEGGRIGDPSSIPLSKRLYSMNFP